MDHHKTPPPPRPSRDGVAESAWAFFIVHDQALLMGNDAGDDVDAHKDASARNSTSSVCFEGGLGAVCGLGSTAADDLEGEIRHLTEQLKHEKRQRAIVMARHEKETNDTFAAMNERLQKLENKLALQDAIIASHDTTLKKRKKQRENQRTMLQARKKKQASRAMIAPHNIATSDTFDDPVLKKLYEEVKEKRASHEAIIATHEAIFKELQEKNAPRDVIRKELKEKHTAFQDIVASYDATIPPHNAIIAHLQETQQKTMATFRELAYRLRISKMT